MQKQEETLTMLRLGVNFAPEPGTVPTRDITAAVETAVSRLYNQDASNLRMRICGILRAAKAPLHNQLRQQTTELKKLEGIVIQTAEKAIATVVMDKVKKVDREAPQH